MLGKKASDEQRALILELRATGLTFAEIGERVGLSQSLCSHVAVAAGLRTNVTVTDEQRKRVVEMGQAGTPRNDVAKAVGLNRGTVLKIWLAAGVTPPSAVLQARERIAELRNTGATKNAIAAKLGISLTTVDRAFAKLGIAPPPPPPRPKGARAKAEARARAEAATLAVRVYSMTETYVPGQRIDHPTFGRGLVERVLEGGKMIVTFDEHGERTLACGKVGR